ncbi:hypothetical protein [Duganella vulcania]|uniref:Uncharacterized protein n=1 Tax=Duganella vulcania TaxID=2692166 RepID=A0A845GGP3_9BURK|nr:hypothetical protein [Duganella vulcania]MYM92565.1 hypothetical protein [Duganella vulcania]
MANSEIAKNIVKLVDAQKRVVARQWALRASGRVPLFPEYRQSTVEHFLDLGMSETEIIARLSEPEPEKAWPGRAAMQGLSSYATAGLPLLRGSAKQVAWATTIRAGHAAKVPQSVHLTQQREASWWIENQRNL